MAHSSIFIMRLKSFIYNGCNQKSKTPSSPRVTHHLRHLLLRRFEPLVPLLSSHSLASRTLTGTFELDRHTKVLGYGDGATPTDL
ncbi:hypothetical protein CR513_58268, partial [Mucuna pruriens]